MTNQQWINTSVIVVTQFDSDTLQVSISRKTWSGSWLIDSDKLTDGKSLQKIIDMAYVDFQYFGDPKMKPEEETQ